MFSRGIQNVIWLSYIKFLVFDPLKVKSYKNIKQNTELKLILNPKYSVMVFHFIYMCIEFIR